MKHLLSAVFAITTLLSTPVVAHDSTMVKCDSVFLDPICSGDWFYKSPRWFYHCDTTHVPHTDVDGVKDSLPVTRARTRCILDPPKLGRFVISPGPCGYEYG